MAYRFSFDLGISSIGWAVIELDGKQLPSKVSDLGVRKFSSGREPKSQAPLAATRRQQRHMRRQRDRYLRRRSKLLNALTRLKLMPSDPEERRIVAACRHKSMQNDLAGFRDPSPYHLRAKALDAPISPYSLGRVLFDLNQHRGFLSNRKAEVSESKDFYQGIEGLENDIAKHIDRRGGTGTLGSYFSERLQQQLPVRDNRSKADGTSLLRVNLQTTRKMYVEEFDQIKAAQQNHQNLSDDDWEALKKIIFCQRPLAPVEKGSCSLYPHLPAPSNQRAYKADPLFQTYRIWQDINNLKIISPSAGVVRHLSDDERDVTFNLLRSQKSITFKSLKSKLKLEHSDYFNLESAKNGKLKGAETIISFMKLAEFSENWKSVSDEQMSDLIEILQSENDESKLIDVLTSKFNLSNSCANELMSVKLEPGTSRFCTQALSDLIRVMAETCIDSETNRYPSSTEAIKELSPALSKDKSSRLQYYAAAIPGIGLHQKHRTSDLEREFGVIGNPTVHIALNQLRLVTNALVERYGEPESIHIEIARDLKMNKDQKANYERSIRANRKLKEEFSEIARKAKSRANPDSREDFQRYKLWKELSEDPTSRCCPYTGTPISLSMLFSEKVNIEHILPRSRSMDDSMANLTISTRDANKIKGNLTPFEYFEKTKDESGYEALLKRVAHLPKNKQWRFLPDAVAQLNDQDGWLSSMLNDTKYLSRLAAQYLGTICEKVQVSPGRLTAKARGQWFGQTIQKDRDTDERHHALDAVVVGLIDKSMILKSQKASAKNDRGQTYRGLELVPPIDRNQLLAQTLQQYERLTVSWAVDHGPEAPLHREQPKKHKDERVVKHLAEQTNSIDFIAIKHQQGSVCHTNYYDKGGIHFVDFWVVPEKQKNGRYKQKITAIPVPYFHSNKDNLHTKKTVKPHPAAKFYMRIYKRDTICVTHKGRRVVARVSQIKPSKGNECIKCTPVNNPEGPEFRISISFSVFLKENVKKLWVSPDGKIKNRTALEA